SALASPPRRISRSTSSGTPCCGKHAMLSAVRGSPPIAYTSESALAAAIAPNSKGSSTMGVKKSTVCTSARSGAIRNTPASSAVEVPTSRSACTTGGSARRTRDRSAGPSLPAQPAARARSVSRKSSDRVRAPLSPSAMSPRYRPGRTLSRTPSERPWRLRSPRLLGRTPSSQLAEIAHADGEAGSIAPVEERDRELPARADQVAKGRGRDLAVGAAMGGDDRLRLLDRGPRVEEVGCDADHPPLALEHAEHLRQAPARDVERLLQLAEIGGHEPTLREEPL